MPAYVYKITNTVNNKQYVGATITPIKDRWSRHVCDSKHSRDGQALHAAIRKYGPDSFTVEQLYEHEDPRHVFDIMENHFIKLHKTHGSEGGYNMTWGGDGWTGMTHSAESIEKMRNAKLGKKMSPEACANMSKVRKGKPTWNKGLECPQISAAKKGHRFTDEIKEKFAESHRGVVRGAETREKMTENMAEDHQIQHPDGRIEEVHNLRQFCKDMGISQGNLVTYGYTKDFKLISTTKNVRTYKILEEKTGIVHETKNMRQFCKDANISSAGLRSKYAIGKAYCGWKILDITFEKEEKVY